MNTTHATTPLQSAPLSAAARRHTATTESAVSLVPFDLERAKAGDPVQTRDGRRFQFVAHRPSAEDVCERVAFRGAKRELLLVSEQGRYLRTGAPSYSDLFMVAEWEPSFQECKAFALAAGVAESILADSHITLVKYAIMHGAVPSSSEVAA